MTDLFELLLKFQLVPTNNLEKVEQVLQEVKQAIQNGADVNCEDYFGLTPLHHAVAGCALPLVKLLISHGARLDKLDDLRGTILDVAWNCDFPNREIIEFLMEKGAK
jgi:ankyrin repeat protein